MAAVRPLREVRVWSPDRERCAAFVKRATDEFGVNAETGARIAISAVARPRDAVAEADIICAVSGATSPIIESGWIRAGTHINAVGAHRPHERELDSATIQRARVFVDYMPSAMEEAGDILIPIGEKTIDRTHVLGDLTSLVTNRVPGRVEPKDVTVFKSVGLAIEDLAAAARAYHRALATGAGTRIASTP
jgi:ornithine cyclodeaminase